MRYMENKIDVIILEFGGLERVKGTPLPIVYVAHLRLFLLGYLLSLPYVYGHTWGWFTIPAVFITGYALLGIDGAAVECESPFKQNRPNHLNMESFCLTALTNIEQLVIHHADIEMR
jgi:putative membrane protein